MGNHSRAINSLPIVQVIRERVGFVPVELGGEKRINPTLAQNLRQVGGVTKGIWQPTDFDDLIESRAEITLPIE